MRHRIARTLLAACIASAASAATADGTVGDSPATGEIALERTESGYSIAAIVTGQAGGTVTAELSIEKQDSAGRMSTRQGGELTLSPGQSATVAQSAISLRHDGRIEAILTLSHDSEVFDRIERSIGAQADDH